MRHALLEERRVVLACGERRHAEALRMPSDNVERVGTHRTGGTEDGEAFAPSPLGEGRGEGHAPPSFSDNANAATGRVEVSASMRSRMPPWPGRSELESL